MKKTKILVVDDHELFLAGIRDMMLKYEEYDVDIQSDIDTFKLLDLRAYDILLTDLSMPGMNGFELLEYAKSENPELSIYILSLHDGVGHIQKAKNIGARGYLLKEESEAQFLKALRSTKSEFYLSEKLRQKLDVLQEPTFQLTPREKEILTNIIQNKSNLEISSLLSISVFTVKTHRKNILAKLKVSRFDTIHSYAQEYLTI